MGEYVRFFLQLSARNIHLLSRYPAAGEYGGPQLGFDNIYNVYKTVQGLGDLLLQNPCWRA